MSRKPNSIFIASALSTLALVFAVLISPRDPDPLLMFGLPTALVHTLGWMAAAYGVLLVMHVRAGESDE